MFSPIVVENSTGSCRREREIAGAGRRPGKSRKIDAVEQDMPARRVIKNRASRFHHRRLAGAGPA